MLPRSRRLGLNLILHPVAGLKPLVVDPDRLKQVLINLLDNSFKFTPAEGKVEVKAIQERNETIIRVSDSGCGISLLFPFPACLFPSPPRQTHANGGIP